MDNVLDHDNLNINFSLKIENDSEEKLKAIKRCDNAFVNPITKREQFESLFKKINEFAEFIVAYSNEICGYIAIYANNKQDKVAFVSLIAVHPEFQNMHVGSALLKAGEELAIDKGMKYLRLEVKINNKNAIRFYEKHGFQVLNHTNRDSWYMQKAL